ncbi:MAG: class A beta-lactamase [Rhizomicrobium sp.]
MPITRRAAALGAALLPFAPSLAADLSDPLDALEKRTGGRLGVAVLDTHTGKCLEHRAQERFAMCSTFKFLLAAAVLQRIDAGKESAERILHYQKSDLLSHSPITEKHVVEGGMAISALCQAAVEFSDNTAANLLLETIGGPAGWTRFARTLGDSVSRLDRTELALNSAIPGDARDTTTPAAMLQDMKKVLLENTLSDVSRQELQAWMIANTIGAHRLRAGLPKDWRAGDKTGTSFKDASNDIAIIWPPDRAPILACVYFAESGLPDEARDAAIADVGRVIGGGF